MRQRLLDAVGADGGWAYYPDKASRIEPTAWALLALGVTGQDEPTRQAALDWLASLGCDVAQGYHIGRPMAPEAVLEVVERRRVPGDSQAPSALRLVGSS